MRYNKYNLEFFGLCKKCDKIKNNENWLLF
jgi:hypothetical protein